MSEPFKKPVEFVAAIEAINPNDDNLLVAAQLLTAAKRLKKDSKEPSIASLAKDLTRLSDPYNKVKKGSVALSKDATSIKLTATKPGGYKPVTLTLSLEKEPFTLTVKGRGFDDTSEGDTAELTFLTQEVLKNVFKGTKALPERELKVDNNAALVLRKLEKAVSDLHAAIEQSLSWWRDREENKKDPEYEEDTSSNSVDFSLDDRFTILSYGIDELSSFFDGDDKDTLKEIAKEIQHSAKVFGPAEDWDAKFVEQLDKASDRIVQNDDFPSVLKGEGTITQLVKALSPSIDCARLKDDSVPALKLEGEIFVDPRQKNLFGSESVYAGLQRLASLGAAKKSRETLHDACVKLAQQILPTTQVDAAASIDLVRDLKNLGFKESGSGSFILKPAPSTSRAEYILVTLSSGPNTKADLEKLKKGQDLSKWDEIIWGVTEFLQGESSNILGRDRGTIKTVLDARRFQNAVAAALNSAK